MNRDVTSGSDISRIVLSDILIAQADVETAAGALGGCSSNTDFMNVSAFKTADWFLFRLNVSVLSNSQLTRSYESKK